jgi:hypothetical protein
MPKKRASSSLRVTLGPAVGSAKDFWALGYCPELDALEREAHPDHVEFTYIFHYQPPERTLVARFPRRLDGIWRCSDGTLNAVGNTDGIVKLTPAGIVEVPLADFRGIFSNLWGSSDDHLFAVGSLPAFAYYCRRGTWLQLPLPAGAEGIRDVRGFSESDVYFVGDHGQVHHFDGQQVTRLRVPVRQRLTGIAQLDGTRVCISGYHGTLIVGNKVRWRHVVTETSAPLLALAVLDGRIYYGADGAIWSTDGIAAATPFLQFPARWVSGLTDGLVFSHELAAKLYTAGSLVDLNVAI